MATDKSELRQLTHTYLLQALDAIAMAKGMERHVYIEAVLMAEAKREAHAASVISRCLQGNPLLSESSGAPQ